jgi:hypothetical protein
VVTPLDDGPSPVPDKEAFMYGWVRHDASRPQLPRPPATPGHRTRRAKEVIQRFPRWRIDSERGTEYSARLVKRPLHMILSALMTLNYIYFLCTQYCIVLINCFYSWSPFSARQSSKFRLQSTIFLVSRPRPDIDNQASFSVPLRTNQP